MPELPEVETVTSGLNFAIKNLDRFDYNKNIKKYFKLVSEKL